MMTEAKYPFHHTAGAGPSNRDWWPNQLKLDFLRQLRVARPGRGCAGAGAQQKFVEDFVAAWDRVMNLDRFDLA